MLLPYWFFFVLETNCAVTVPGISVLLYIYKTVLQTCLIMIQYVWDTVVLSKSSEVCV